MLSFNWTQADTTQATTASTSPVAASKLEIGTRVQLAFNDARMVPVLICESGLKQFDDDGTPKISPTSDVGIGQVNRTHWKRAKKLGLDIFNSEEDNLKMAKIIYDEQGIEAWSVYGGKCYQKNLKALNAKV